ncbi:DMT family transporter [Rhodoferax aquaticus]|uniref:EamA/RhaT family transporter n=1 Tax=Rhodoferax aquaticus TaxID=2527691 RepID=A0A515EL43_9BURK|nr:EamA family transporter [Rhodoferax aquaticus]QDL53377.1 EamA/RhaT family transporter [Rhodoferax aquaticus]
MKTKYFAQLVALSALWGASFLFIRIASPVFGPNVLALLRVSLATVTLAVLMRVMRQPWNWQHWRTLATIGALSVTLPFVLFAWAGLQIPAGYSALLNSTAVIFGMFASARMGEDTITTRKVLGCVCGFAGVAFIVSLGPVQLTPQVALAVLACVVASACYGFSAPITKQAVGHMQPLQIAAGLHVLALPMLIPGAVYSLPQAHFSLPALLAVMVMGVATSGLAYWAHLRILRHVTPVAAMSPIFMVPVFGVLWGHLFLGEELGGGVLVGGSLILLASALITGFNPLRSWPKATNAGS